MEKLLELYALAYDAEYPVLCFEERPCYLIEQTLMPVPMQSGRVKREDYSYSVKASCCVLLAIEPLTGRWLKLYKHRMTTRIHPFYAVSGNTISSKLTGRLR